MQTVNIMDDGSEKVPSKLFRFDIFKGRKDADGKVQRVKSVGHAFVFEGSSTYNVRINSFLGVEFFLLPERKETEEADYVILTREVSHKSGRRFYWHNVGEARFLESPNSGLMAMQWDLFGRGDIYMNLYPIEIGARTITSVENKRADVATGAGPAA